MLSHGRCAITVAAAALLIVSTAADAKLGGTPYAEVGNWEVQKYSGYCAATAKFDSGRALRIHAASTGASSFGFRGEGAANFT